MRKYSVLPLTYLQGREVEDKEEDHRQQRQQQGWCVCVRLCVVQRVAAHVCEGRRGEAEARHHGRGPGASGCVWGAWPTQAPATPCPASLCTATPCPLVSPLAGVGPRGVLGVEDLEGEVGRRIRGSQARSGGCMFQQADRVTIQSRPAAAGQQAPPPDLPAQRLWGVNAAHLLRLLLQAAGQLVHLPKDGHPRVGQPRPPRHLRGMGAGRQVACRMSRGR